MHALCIDIVYTHDIFFSICISGDMLHINMVSWMRLLPSAHLPWLLNGVCSSLLRVYGAFFCSWICMGTSVLKREAVTLGKQQAGFPRAEPCVAGAGSGPPNGARRQPSQPFQLHLHLCIIRAAEAAAVIQWLLVNSYLTILLPGKENFSLFSFH